MEKDHFSRQEESQFMEEEEEEAQEIKFYFNKSSQLGRDIWHFAIACEMAVWIHQKLEEALLKWIGPMDNVLSNAFYEDLSF